MQLYILQIDNHPDGIIPARRRNIGLLIDARQQYGGEGMAFEEDEDVNLDGVEARNQFIEGAFGQNRHA